MRSSVLLAALAAATSAVFASTTGPTTSPTTSTTIPSINDLLEFDPPLASFRLAETQDTATPLRVRLRQAPRAPATLYLESANLKFSLCNVRFLPHSYDTWQIVDVRGLPYFTDADRARDEIINMRMSCPQGGNGWHGRNWTYPVERPAGVKGATCISNGDPHITTFDGKYYSYQGLGTFYLLKSESMTVQTVTDTWNDGATVSVATGIRYGPAHFIVDSRESEPGKRLVQLSGDANGVDVVVSTNDDEFRFRFPDGSAITIQYSAAAPRNSLNHQIDVPACLKGKTNGWCGTYTDTQDDDWTAADGSIQTDMNTFGESWRVPATDDMFLCKDQCPDALAARRAIKPCDQCRIPDTLQGAGVYVETQPGYSQWKGARSSYAGKKPTYAKRLPAPRVARDPAFDSRAQAACNAAFNFPDARNVVDPTPFLRACVSDCQITRSLAMVDSKKTAYLNNVYTHIRPIINLAAMMPARKSGYAQSPEAVQCRKAADTLGLGTSRCPQNCSSHGVCRKGGCVCRAGWTGQGCAQSLNAYGIPLVSGGGRVANTNVYQPPRTQQYQGNVNGARDNAQYGVSGQSRYPSDARRGNGVSPRSSIRYPVSPVDYNNEQD